MWVDIMDPSADDLKFLKNNFKIHSLTMKAIIPVVYNPDFDVFKNYIFMILHYLDDQEMEGEGIDEFDIIAGKDFFITTHQKYIQPLNYIFEECSKSEQKRKEYMGKTASYLLFSVLNAFFKKELSKINQIEDEIDSVEKEIFLGKEKKMVIIISSIKRKIINFWRVIEPEKNVFKELKIYGPKFFGPDTKHHFSILLRNYRKIENILKNSKEAIESLESTNNIMVNLKINEIISILTVFSAIMLPLTFIASIWGMNTNFLPFSEHPLGFWLVMIVMLLTFIGMIIYFKRKKWL